MPHGTQPLTEPTLLLTTAEMAAVDRAAIAAGIGIDTLMQAAGAAVADAVPEGGSVCVLCGPGNNGGDGYVAARLLAARGLDVTVFAEAPPRAGGAAFRQFELWRGDVRPLADFAPAAGQVVIDGLYGAGLDRPIEGPAAEAIARLNGSGAEVVAIDVPSGLSGDSGLPTGPVVAADRTVTFFRPKPGHLLWPGRKLCGELRVRDIGLTAAHAGAAPALFENTPALWRSFAAGPAPEAHKYLRGHCLVVSGPELQTGAARLSAVAALNAGAGAVTIAGTRDALRVHAAHVTAIMLKEAADAEALAALLATAHASAAVIGPAAGVGERTAGCIAALLAAEVPLVLDADALTSLVGQLGMVATRPAPASAVVMTPHAGEFERLFAGPLAGDASHAALPPALRASKVEKARAAARAAGAVVVFKGIDTVIAAPDGRAAIGTNAGPELATAGSGDVLSGLIGAHLAQGAAAFEAACSGVWLHGVCGARFGIGLTADRLVDLVRPLAAFVPD